MLMPALLPMFPWVIGLPVPGGIFSFLVVSLTMAAVGGAAFDMIQAIRQRCAR